VAALALAGCGAAGSDAVRVVSSAAPGSAATPATSTAGAATSAPSARLLAAAEKAAQRSASVEVRLGTATVMTGAVDPAAGRSHLRIDLGAALSAALGSLPSAGATAGSTPLGDLTSPMDVVTDGGRAYLNLGGLGRLLGVPPDRPWVALDDPSQATGLTGAAGDPAQALGQLRAITGDVSAQGTEEVQGVPTTQYTATLRLADVLAGVAPSEREAVDRAVAASGLDLSSLAVPLGVWIDGEGLPRRLTMDLAPVLSSVAGATGAGGNAGVAAAVGALGTTTIEFSHWGEPVTVTVPPPAQVVDARDVPGLGTALGHR
jgi:hypothetical protein